MTTPPHDTSDSPDVSAQTLAKQIQRESRLRDIIDQSSYRFYFGETALSIGLRLLATSGLCYLYFHSVFFITLSFWPIFAIGGLIESIRANRRIDAMIELENLKTKQCESERITEE